MYYITQRIYQLDTHLTGCCYIIANACSSACPACSCPHLIAIEPHFRVLLIEQWIHFNRHRFVCSLKCYLLAYSVHHCMRAYLYSSLWTLMSIHPFVVCSFYWAACPSPLPPTTDWLATKRLQIFLFHLQSKNDDWWSPDDILFYPRRQFKTAIQNYPLFSKINGACPGCPIRPPDINHNNSTLPIPGCPL